MLFNFPAIKTNRTTNEQFEKVIDEIEEYLNEEEGLNKDKEAIDILHSVETFLRVRFKGREKQLDDLIESTRIKNSNRGYYDQECH